MPTIETLSADVLAELAKYDTPTICNAIEKFKVRPSTQGYMNHTIRCHFEQMPPMVGYAITSKHQAAKPGMAGDNPYGSLFEQFEQMDAVGAPTVIVYEDTDNPSVAATFGEMMCSSYKAAGAVGIITSGSGRDLDQVEAIGLAVFTGLGANPSHGYCATRDVGADVQVGGITVKQFDLLHGDRNGVTTIPHAIAADLPQMCARIVEYEIPVLDHCRAGKTTVKDLQAAWLQSQKRVQADA